MPAVGMTTRAFVDRERPDWDGTGNRPLAVTLWYPAPDAAPRRTLSVGPPRAPFFELAGMAVNAPVMPSPDGRSVVLLSHGTGGTATGMGWLAVRLAASGHIVLAVDHHGNTAMERYRAEGFLAWWERPRDLSVALDLVLDDPAFNGRIDTGRVHAAGFSLGGQTALALAGARYDDARFSAFAADHRLGGVREFPDAVDQKPKLVAESAVFRASLDRHGHDHADARVRSAYAIAPAPPVRGFTDDSLAALCRPVCLLVGGGDAIAPAATCSRWLADRLPRCRLVEKGPEVGHYVFLPEGLPGGRGFDPVLFVDPPGVDRRSIHHEAATLALDLIETA